MLSKSQLSASNKYCSCPGSVFLSKSPRANLRMSQLKMVSMRSSKSLNRGWPTTSPNRRRLKMDNLNSTSRLTWQIPIKVHLKIGVKWLIWSKNMNGSWMMSRMRLVASQSSSRLKLLILRLRTSLAPCRATHVPS